MDNAVKRKSETQTQSLQKTDIEEYKLLFRYLCSTKFIESDVVLIEKVLNYIWEKYSKQTPVEVEVILNELIDIATIGIEMMNLDVASVMAIMLFPLYENKIINNDTVEENFGSEVAKLLKGILKISKINVKEKDFKDDNEKQKQKQKNKIIAIQNENHIKLLLTFVNDIRVIIIRLAYRLNLMRKMIMSPTAERTRIARETASIYAPIAHRLGLYIVKGELEELSMRYLENQMYNFLSLKLTKTKTDREAFIQEFIQPLREYLEREGFDCEIKGRPKSIHSIWRKMQKQNVSFEEVYDLFAIRIILNKYYKTKKEEKDDCWKVYSLITDIYQPNPKRLRDWISHPKNTGYESLHTTVLSHDRKWVEVQIRTRRMDDIAEKGQAAHWKYKEGGTGNKAQGFDSLLKTLRDSLENQQPEKNSTDEAKKELYSKEIFIFTPDREIKRLRTNGTVLDFAYSVHTNLGEHCIGGEVNGRFQPINFELQNGDEVRIVTSKNQQPNAEWLNIATSPRALSKIKKHLTDALYKNLEQGKEIIKHKCEQAKIEFNDTVLRKLLKYYKKYQNFQEFYEAVGREEVDASTIKEILQKPENENKENKKVVVDYDKIKEKKVKHDHLVIDSLGKIDYELAKCCSPVLGDDIFGFITASKGTKIHKTSCKNAEEMRRRYPYRIVKAKWTEGEYKSAFKAIINIEGVKKDNLFTNVYKVLHDELRLSIAKIKVDERQRNNTYLCQAVIYVNNKNHLNYIIDKVTKMPNVVRAYRQTL